MSILSGMMSWKLLDKKQTLSNKNSIQKAKREKEEYKTEKQIRKEMKEKLSPEDYYRWYHRTYYHKSDKEKTKMRNDNKSKIWFEETKKLLLELYWEDKKEQTIDEYYIEKYRADDVDSDWRYRQRWWITNINNLLWKHNNISFPIRVAENYDMDYLMTRQFNIQLKAFKYLRWKDINICQCSILSNWRNNRRDPMWWGNEEYIRLVNNAEWINRQQISEMIRRLQEWVFIPETWVWYKCFMVWDIIATSMWHMFKIALENNLDWLTKDTIDDIHKQRIEFRYWWDKIPKWFPIARMNNCYLIKIPADKIVCDDWNIEHHHYNYYIVPMKWLWNKYKLMTKEEFKQKRILVDK